MKLIRQRSNCFNLAKILMELRWIFCGSFRRQSVKFQRRGKLRFLRCRGTADLGQTRFDHRHGRYAIGDFIFVVFHELLVIFGIHEQSGNVLRSRLAFGAAMPITEFVSVVGDAFAHLDLLITMSHYHHLARAMHCRRVLFVGYYFYSSIGMGMMMVNFAGSGIGDGGRDFQQRCLGQVLQCADLILRFEIYVLVTMVEMVKISQRQY
mmetsp:Transcript_2671/g.4905  ORF Transcript_2671/g.4905 Transcript_2671/m.4905 type:complete len:208 (+) Transcript_2671:669-1292(+)